MNNKGVRKTALATPGLLERFLQLLKHEAITPAITKRPGVAGAVL